MKNKLQYGVTQIKKTIFITGLFFLLSGNLLPMKLAVSFDGDLDQAPVILGGDFASVEARFPGVFHGSPKPFEVRQELEGGDCTKAFLCQSAKGPLVVAKIKIMKGPFFCKVDVARREIDNHRSCEHSAISRVIHCEKSSDERYWLLIMEYADAGPLSNQIEMRAREKKKFIEKEIMLPFIQLLLAIDHLHSMNMLHRDINPANVFITTQGQVKLGDFGCSKVFKDGAQRPRRASFCGTRYYMAPEQIEGEYNLKIDMWALGVVLFEMAALERPYTGDTPSELYARIRKGEYNPSLLEGYSEDLMRLVARLLNLSPDERPDTKQLLRDPYVQHWLREFEQWAAQSPSLSEEQKRLIHNDILRVTSSAQSSNSKSGDDDEG